MSPGSPNVRTAALTGSAAAAAGTSDPPPAGAQQLREDGVQQTQAALCDLGLHRCNAEPIAATTARSGASGNTDCGSGSGGLPPQEDSSKQLEGDSCCWLDGGESSSEGAPPTAAAAASCWAPRVQTLNPAASLLRAGQQQRQPQQRPGSSSQATGSYSPLLSNSPQCGCSSPTAAAAAAAGMRSSASAGLPLHRWGGMLQAGRASWLRAASYSSD